MTNIIVIRNWCGFNLWRLGPDIKLHWSSSRGTLINNTDLGTSHPIPIFYFISFNTSFAIVFT